MNKLKLNRKKKSCILENNGIKSIWYTKQEYKKQKTYKMVLEQSLLNFPF